MVATGLSYARENGLTGSEAKKPQSDLSEEVARKRLEGLSGAAAIAFARKHNLI